MPDGRVPLVLASAGPKRILALSYLLVWAWQGHRFAANSIKQLPERRLVLLFDEPETHLHPQWQRRVVPSLLRAVEALGGITNVQVIVSTHAPLVLASVETQFDASMDALHHLDAGAHGPAIERVEFARRVDMVGWLVSPAVRHGAGSVGRSKGRHRVGGAVPAGTRHGEPSGVAHEVPNRRPPGGGAW